MTTMKCRVRDREKDTTTVRVAARPGLGMRSLTLTICGEHAADIDGGNPPTKVDFGKDTPCGGCR